MCRLEKRRIEKLNQQVDPLQGNKGIKDRLEFATINKFMFDDLLIFMFFSVSPNIEQNCELNLRRGNMC